MQDGILALYGPFKVNGQFTSDGNRDFDASLRGRNASWGIREMDQVVDIALKENLGHVETIPMPANNFLILFRRSA